VIQHVELQDQGLLAEVALLPDENLIVADVGSPYSGNGFGLVVAPQEGDTVLVCIPEGDTDVRPVIVARMWGPQEPAPADAAAPNDGATNDVVLRVENGKHLRIFTAQGGNVKITVQGQGNVDLVVDGGVVRLGADTHVPLDGVVTGRAFDPFTGQTHFALGNASSKVFARKT
jgi:uncharacterized protein involved in type VI secretion and phage assembly